ncbi:MULTISPECIES: 23S rRNA (uracil(1939)-C(5))-methyltransferase RlmD [unclassified Clostridium]|uniref:23S rRNA (uracil(1939)-C(5))-methyltransferase RlmD n=1 Tax=unclassified Clostridium TaxID=2614128 RepID=UPI00029746E4|nr:MULTISPECIES: 23S rRNA (uracil(1939)-C(5))-methyltransferase RlmD [unclassified Clostridium]EKQ50401.1 MAG: 23S rRNA (uracil-5-)-methyltransferase RumA [Clostridium sp. Maddingley MBC34-26]
MIENNKEYIVKIDSLGYEGEGVAKINRYPIFIPGALKGETVKVEITKSKKNYAHGRLLEVLEKSNERKSPECIDYEKCGGCTLMHLSYEGQLDFKYNRVKDCIERIAGLDGKIVKYPIGMKNPYRYRNKAIFSVGSKENELSIGFFSEKTHEIVNVNSCQIQDKASDRIIEIIRSWMMKNAIASAKKDGVFFEQGLIRNIMIRKGFKTNEVMVVLVTTDKEIPYKEELISKLKNEIINLKSLIQNINNKDTNVVLGDKNITLWGQDYISDYIGQYKFNISPLSFFQVNPIQTEILYGKALEYADLNGDEIVFDAYCGTGTITLFLSQKAKKVYGVEIVDQAIEDAVNNARANTINNSKFYVGKSEEVIPRLIKEGIKPDVIVVDPPRKGCDVRLLEAIGRAKPERIVYVSCDPGTLARDLKHLEEMEYKTLEVQPVDMFPNTKHVECVVVMHRKNSL